jgi:hypothetical protein
MNDGNQTPLQEAVSLITIVAILAAVGCYAGAAQNVPGLTPGVFWIASLVYAWLPVLSVLQTPQMPILIGSAAVGLALFVCTIPFASLLAGALGKAQLQNVERHMIRLKKNRAKLQRKARARDNFIVR